MSESYIILRYTHNDMGQNDKNKIKEKIIRFMKAVEKPAREEYLEISSNSQEDEVRIEHFSLMEIEIEQLLSELTENELENLYAETWCDTVGETFFYTLVNGSLAIFKSSEEMHSHLNELKQNRNQVFEYGKSRDNKTGLIRLDFSSNASLKRYLKMFSSLLTQKSIESLHVFQQRFDENIKANAQNVSWCQIEVWGKNGLGREVKKGVLKGAPELVYYLLFVEVCDSSLYMGFDLTEITSSLTEFEITVSVLYQLKGVKKVWLKLRESENTINENYSYWPSPCDEVTFVEQELSEDSDWPVLGTRKKLAPIINASPSQKSAWGIPEIGPKIDEKDFDLMSLQSTCHEGLTDLNEEHPHQYIEHMSSIKWLLEDLVDNNNYDLGGRELRADGFYALLEQHLDILQSEIMRPIFVNYFLAFFDKLAVENYLGTMVKMFIEANELFAFLANELHDPEKKSKLQEDLCTCMDLVNLHNKLFN